MKRNNKAKNKSTSNLINNNILNQRFQNEIYDENSEYEIPPITLRNKNENNLKYMEKLESKIRAQAKKIADLNKYKYLCEKRIRQLNPNEILPLTIDSLSDESIYNNMNTMNNMNNFNDNDSNLNINKKYELLNEQYQKLLNDYSEIIKKNNMNDSSNNTITASNQNDKYKIMKEKYKRIKEENKKVIELLKEQTKACEMQKNIINILKQAIDNDICKNNDLKKYINIDNVVDFTQLKMESEQYRKELVLSQALVNSLKSEIEQLNKEKEEGKFNYNRNNNNNIGGPNTNFDYNNNNNFGSMNNDENINAQNQRMNDMNLGNYYGGDKNNNNNNLKDNNLIMSENISLKTTLNNQEKLIKELMDENKSLKKLVDEATIKLNDCIANKNENMMNNENLNFQLNSKIDEIKQYEDKFIYFNDYITIIKTIFMNFQQSLPKFINIYNKMANEDLNSLLSNTFSQSIIQLNNRINQLNKIEKFNLETNIETDITNIIIELLQILNNEFISIYEKVFQTNSYYIESNKKVEELQLQIKENENINENNLKKINDINDLLNNEKKNMDEYKNTVEDYKLKLNICELEKDNLNKKIESYIDDKNNIVNCYYIMIKALAEYNENLAQLLRDCVNIIETKSKLFTEKEIIMEQLTKNKIKDLNRNKLYQNNPEVNKMVTQEQITLQNLINEFDNKIREKENQLMANKEKIKQYLLDMQNKPLIQKNNNGLNNNYNYNYNYYIKKDNYNDNGKNDVPSLMNYNINNRTNSNNVNDNSNTHTINSNDDSNINRRNKNGTTYALVSNPASNFKLNNNKNDQLDNNYESDINSQNQIIN